MENLLSFLQEKVKNSKTKQELTVYRTALVKAIINSYPANHYIPTSEFEIPLGLKPHGSYFYSMISRMVTRGEISRQHINGRVYYQTLKPGYLYEAERKQAWAEKNNSLTAGSALAPEAPEAHAPAASTPAASTPVASTPAASAPAPDEYSGLKLPTSEATSGPYPIVPVAKQYMPAPKTYSFKELEKQAIRFQFYNHGAGVSDFLIFLKES